MYPCFLFGTALRNYWPTIQNHSNIIALISGALFIAMLIPWDESFWKISEKAIYPIHSSKQYFSFLYPFYYRMAIGLLGAVFIIMICEIAGNKLSESRLMNVFSNIGKETLGIYLIQTIVIETLMWRFARFDNVSIPLFQYVIAPMISLAVLVVCIATIKMLRKSHIMSRFFLGDK